jgi:hypothetical protein
MKTTRNWHLSLAALVLLGGGPAARAAENAKRSSQQKAWCSISITNSTKGRPPAI